MIELKIDGDLARYIDTEELQRNAEYEVKSQIKNAVTQLLKSDEGVQKMLEGVVAKVIGETDISGDVKQLIQDKVFSSVESMSNWDVRYSAKIDDVFKEVAAARDDEIHGVVNQKIDDMLSIYEVEKYAIDCGIKDIITEKIMSESENIDIKEKLTMFVRNGLDRTLEQLSY